MASFASVFQLLALLISKIPGQLGPEHKWMSGRYKKDAPTGELTLRKLVLYHNRKMRLLGQQARRFRQSD